MGQGGAGRILHRFGTLPSGPLVYGQTLGDEIRRVFSVPGGRQIFFLRRAIGTSVQTIH